MINEKWINIQAFKTIVFRLRLYENRKIDNFFLLIKNK